MTKKTILYLHGLGSGGNSSTSQLLQQQFPDCTVYAPELPINPDEAYLFIRNTVTATQPYFIIGTSLGAFYAAQMSGCIKFLINPVFNPVVTLSDKIGMGVHRFLLNRSDGSTTYTIDQPFIDMIACQQERLFNKQSYLDSQVTMETFAVFGTDDNIVQDQPIYNRYYETDAIHSITVNMGHRVDATVLVKDIVPYINRVMEYCNTINWETVI